MSVNNLKQFPILDGELMHYPTEKATWVENEPIYLTLTIADMQRGRSAAYFIWSDSIGRKWPMFMTDLEDVLRNETVRKGKVSAFWKVRKRGSNYGIALAEVPQ